MLSNELPSLSQSQKQTLDELVWDLTRITDQRFRAALYTTINQIDEDFDSAQTIQKIKSLEPLAKQIPINIQCFQAMHVLKLIQYYFIRSGFNILRQVILKYPVHYVPAPLMLSRQQTKRQKRTVTICAPLIQIQHKQRIVNKQALVDSFLKQILVTFNRNNLQLVLIRELNNGVFDIDTWLTILKPYKLLSNTLIKLKNNNITNADVCRCGSQIEINKQRRWEQKRMPSTPLYGITTEESEDEKIVYIHQFD
ncbi:Hypothetical_protein [Hexamita inflata]|uniref:Hypothetical_protein n=1 Tax=Hexamita inflata TaxID=28002 RepID=A0AA86RFG5_9EUKA|nr:Hypothetical protein HINF_LOCUS59963 [Hexamita inflata]